MGSAVLASQSNLTKPIERNNARQFGAKSQSTAPNSVSHVPAKSSTDLRQQQPPLGSYGNLNTTGDSFADFERVGSQLSNGSLAKEKPPAELRPAQQISWSQPPKANVKRTPARSKYAGREDGQGELKLPDDVLSVPNGSSPSPFRSKKTHLVVKKKNIDLIDQLGDSPPRPRRSTQITVSTLDAGVEPTDAALIPEM